MTDLLAVLEKKRTQGFGVMPVFSRWSCKLLGVLIRRKLRGKRRKRNRGKRQRLAEDTDTLRTAVCLQDFAGVQ